MKTLACAALAWLLCAARWPHTTVLISLVVVLVGVWVWSRHGGSPTQPAYRDARYACRQGCGYSASGVQLVARHEAGHAVVSKAEGEPVEHVVIYRNGEGFTRPARDPRTLPDEQYLRFAVAGTLAEGPPSWWSGTEKRINGASYYSDYQVSRRAARRISKRTGEAPAEVIARAQTEARAILAANADQVQELAGRLEQSLRSGEHGKHEGWVVNP